MIVEQWAGALPAMGRAVALAGLIIYLLWIARGKILGQRIVRETLPCCAIISCAVKRPLKSGCIRGTFSEPFPLYNGRINLFVNGVLLGQTVLPQTPLRYSTDGKLRKQRFIDGPKYFMFDGVGPYLRGRRLL
jgi:hypothetical protein